MITPDTRKATREKYARAASDTGSPEVQVALMTQRIRNLTDHLGSNKKDHAGRRGLMMMVGKRTRLLRYLREKDSSRYQSLIESLELRK